MGLDQRAVSPAVLDKIVSANAENKSAPKAKRMLEKLAGVSVSVSVIGDLTATIGKELQEHLQQQADSHQAGTLNSQHTEPPGLATVSIDGGRIMTREAAGRGVHDQKWKETKNACLLTMSSSPSEEDPHPELPGCFANEQYVETLVRDMHTTTAVGQSPENTGVSPNSEASDESPNEHAATHSKRKTKNADWRPKRLMRTCVSSMASSSEFGPLVAGEAQRRGFYHAARRAFLGDGQAWNWKIREEHFPDFVAITDFVHPLGYIYEAAKAIAPKDAWATYLQATTNCWQGRVADVLDQLRTWQAEHLTRDDEAISEQDPRAVVQRAITYLSNNRHRMDYPTYRRAGLPTSTAMIESLIKEINYRVKGTEKFWNRPEGAEYILQVRAAALSDDDRLSQWILNRAGSYFYRPSTPLAAAA